MRMFFFLHVYSVQYLVMGYYVLLLLVNEDSPQSWLLHNHNKY